MSEATFVFDGPPEGWTWNDIRSRLTKMGLKENTASREEIYGWIANEMEQGEKWGFDSGRLYYIRRLQDQYEYGSVSFNNPGCPFCRTPGARCVLVWKTKKGYMTSQCNSAMTDFER